MEDRYIVVSDVHLGGHSNNEPYKEEFHDFLRWVKDLPNNGKIPYIDYEGSEKTITIQPPTKIILLGDIMDIWDPRDRDRINIIKDSTEPLSLLHDIDCEKIYVTGNHDEDIEDLAYMEKSFDWKDPQKLSLYARHYPEGDNIKNGELVNGVRYSFIHGHQYDQEQITYTISKILNTRFDPVDFVQDLANVSFTKKIPDNWSCFLFGVWFFLMISYFFELSLIKNIIGVFFAITGIVFSARYFQEGKKIVSERNESGWYYYSFLVAGIILILLSFYSWKYRNNFFIFFSAGSYILTYVFFVSLIPKVITHMMRGFYLRFRKSKDKSVEEIISSNYNWHKDTMNVNVVVFGHTHKPGACLYKEPDSPKYKLYVNTGCWAKEDEFFNQKRDVKTFAYIDREGISLLKWAGTGNIECMSHDTHRDILRPPLKYIESRICKLSRMLK